MDHLGKQLLSQLIQPISEVYTLTSELQETAETPLDTDYLKGIIPAGEFINDQAFLYCR